MDIFSNIDARLLLELNSHHTAFLDSFWMLFTGRYIWVPMYFALLVVVVRAYGWRKTLTVALLIALAIAVTDQFCGSVLRHTVDRMRPTNPANPLSHLIQTVNGYRGGQYGFPSCHAANSFALVAFFTYLFRSRSLTCFLVLWACCNTYSRLYLGVHYPGDVAVGAIYGFIFGGICGLVARHFSGQPEPLPYHSRIVSLPVLIGLLTVILISAISLNDSLQI